MIPANSFNIFKELIIGVLDKEHLIQRLCEAGIQFNKYANTLFEHPQFSPSSEVEKVKTFFKISPNVCASKISDSSISRHFHPGLQI